MKRILAMFLAVLTIASVSTISVSAATADASTVSGNVMYKTKDGVYRTVNANEVVTLDDGNLEYKNFNKTNWGAETFTAEQPTNNADYGTSITNNFTKDQKLKNKETIVVGYDGYYVDENCTKSIVDVSLPDSVLNRTYFGASVSKITTTSNGGTYYKLPGSQDKPLCSITITNLPSDATTEQYGGGYNVIYHNSLQGGSTSVNIYKQSDNTVAPQTVTAYGAELYYTAYDPATGSRITKTLPTSCYSVKQLIMGVPTSADSIATGTSNLTLKATYEDLYSALNSQIVKTFGDIPKTSYRILSSILPTNIDGRHAFCKVDRSTVTYRTHSSNIVDNYYVQYTPSTVVSSSYTKTWDPIPYYTVRGYYSSSRYDVSPFTGNIVTLYGAQPTATYNPLYGQLSAPLVYDGGGEGSYEIPGGFGYKQSAIPTWTGAYPGQTRVYESGMNAYSDSLLPGYSAYGLGSPVINPNDYKDYWRHVGGSMIWFDPTTAHSFTPSTDAPTIKIGANNIMSNNGSTVPLTYDSSMRSYICYTKEGVVMSYNPSYGLINYTARQRAGQAISIPGDARAVNEWSDTVATVAGTRSDFVSLTDETGRILTYDTIKLSNCASETTLTPSSFGTATCDINGGNYSGTPAVASSGITVVKGTLTDNAGSRSTYIVGPDSEASSTTSGSTTVTQVKLSNPPVIIDWSEFPMPDIAGPVIEVTRTPNDTKTPTDEVTLTVKATDPDGNNDPKPISVDGGSFVASPATYTVKENGTVSILAKDSKGNTRTFNVEVKNVDSEAPTITGFTQSNTEWTRDPVRVTVNATDDVKLDASAYRWSFTPNSTGAKQTGAWTSEKSIRVAEAGKIQVDVRDVIGHIATSDVYEVRNIDTLAPTGTVSFTPDVAHPASAKTGVTAEFKVVNTPDTVTAEASPLSSDAYMWDESEGWTNVAKHVFKENGVYYVKVRDSVGNISAPIQFTISHINTSLPVIDSFTGSNTAAEFVKAPATLKVTAHASGSATLPARPYSWDEGVTWTSQSSKAIMENGEYSVIVRDSLGNETAASIMVSNVDPTPPTAGVYVYKGLPADGSGTGPESYVWKVRVEADDLGSGVDHIETLWDSGTSTVTPVIQDIVEPGIYGAIVYDKAGNKTYAEKIVTAESIGESAGGTNGSYVDITVPSIGSAGSHFNAALQDLVYGPTGAFNKTTNTFTGYLSSAQGITANITATGKTGRTLSGYATFNSVKYPVTFSGATSIAAGKNIGCEVFIPISTVTTDVRNGRLTIVLQEWTDASMTTLAREGSATLYTSVQVNKPKLTYEYNAATDKLLVTGASAVAGISNIGAQLDGGSMLTSFPVSVGSAGSIRMVVRDNVQQETELTVTKDQLKLNGSAGGLLPTETLTDTSVNSYVITTRNSTTYIINGSQSNTDIVPSREVFNSLLG